MSSVQELSEGQLKAKRAAVRGQVTSACKVIEATIGKTIITSEDVDLINTKLNRLHDLSGRLQELNELLESFYGDGDFDLEIKLCEQYESDIELVRNKVRRLNLEGQGSAEGAIGESVAHLVPPGSVTRRILPRTPLNVREPNVNLGAGTTTGSLGRQRDVGSLGGLQATLPPPFNDGGQPGGGQQPSPPIGNGDQQGTGRQPVFSAVKLPKIEIQPFCGDFHKWLGFWEQFQNSIGLSTVIPVATKFNYLKTLLRGPPLDLVFSYELNDQQYQLAVQQLQERYGNTENLKNLHIQALVKLQGTKLADDSRALRLLENEIRLHTTAMKRLKVDIDGYFPLMRKILPKELYMNFKRLNRKSNTIAELLTFLQEELNDLEGWEHDQGEISSLTKSQGREGGDKRFIPTAAVLNVNSLNEESGRRQPCVFCGNGDHGSATCQKELTVQERKDILMSKGRCLKCMRSGHISRNCQFPYARCRKCNGEHFSIICAKGGGNIRVGGSESARSQLEEKSTTMNQVNSEGTQRRYHYLLKTAKINLVNGRRKIKGVCLVDEGSQRTFVREHIAKLLQAPVRGKETLTVAGFGGVHTTQVYDRVVLTLQGVHTNKSIRIEALTTRCPSSHKPPFRDPVIVDSLNQLQLEGLVGAEDFDDPHGLPVDLIIGVDTYHQVMTGAMVKVDQDLSAAESIFGWMLLGKLQVGKCAPLTTSNHVSCLVAAVRESAVEGVNLDIQQLWDLEVIGVQGGPPEVLTDYDDHFEKTIKYDGVRYEVSLPWKDDIKRVLADNYGVAKKRFQGLVARLRRDPVLFHEYDQAIQKYVDDGHAEEVVKSVSGDGRYYLPHQPVYRDSTSTQTRVVFDASSHAMGEVSLNDCLFPGSERQLDLISALLRFQANQWALTGDIQKAFLQIQLCEDDRDYVRYLWVDSQLPESQQWMRPKVFRMKRVVFGVTSSPYLLRKTVQYHVKQFETQYPLAVKILGEHLYVDDVVTSLMDGPLLETVVGNILEIMAKAGLPVHKLHSNYLPLEQQWNPRREPVSVLGLCWDPFGDQLKLVVPVAKLREEGVVTKRLVISRAASVFDPLGWISPLTIQAKIFFQTIWVRRLDWDTPLPEDLCVMWWQWVVAMTLFGEIVRPRYLLRNADDLQVDLHIFSDASPRAYGAVAYVVFRVGGVVQSTLVMSRFRVAPLKYVSLPRLELLGAVLGARLATYLQGNLPYVVQRKWYWTDSAVTFFWITSLKNRSATYVTNRVAEIRKLTDMGGWRHCPGFQNPADLASKPMPRMELPNDSVWWEGPVWLVKEETQWPQFEEPENLSLLLQQYDESKDLICNSNIYEMQLIGLAQLIDVTKFSNRIRLLRVSAKVLEARDRFKRIPIQKDYRTEAEEIWIFVSQYKHFGPDFHVLSKGGQLSKQSKIRLLRPFLDDKGIIRINSRLVLGEWDPELTQPIVLPAEDPFTWLTIQDIHRRHTHAGVSTTLLILRQRFWVLRGRQTVKRVIHRCRVCIRLDRPVAQQPVAPLPEFRVAEVAPFTHVGIDYAGPVYVRGETGSTLKVYIALFTCATTRAVHLEVVLSSNTNDFLLAFRRFVSRRGVPSFICSDNARQFKKAASVLKTELQVLSNFVDATQATPHNIRWKHIVERAPWWGGFWERMVRSVKESLKRALGRTMVRLEEFVTILTEVEATINSRPLSQLSDDPFSRLPITPSQLLLGKDLQQIEHEKVEFVKVGTVPEIAVLRKRIFQHFVSCWRQSYVLQLRSAHMSQPLVARLFYPGQAVLLDEAPKKRAVWPLARVEEVIIGRDGVQRSCMLRTCDGRRLCRAVQRLVPLESELDELSGPPGV